MASRHRRHSAAFFGFLAIFLNLGATKAAHGQGVTSPVVQEPTPPPQPGQTPAQTPGQAEDKRIFGVLPNYRTAEMSAKISPLTSRQKMRIAVKDSFDYPLAFVSAGYAGLYQLENNHPQFGQGAKGYFERLGTSYTDQIVGNILTEGFLPIVFREDPRYFRMSEGSKKKRLFYAASRIVVTRTDSGHSSFNYAEVLGNGMAAGVGLTYYTDSRTIDSYTENLGTQLGTDAISQVLKEFWPDIKRWWIVKHRKDR